MTMTSNSSFMLARCPFVLGCHSGVIEKRAVNASPAATIGHVPVVSAPVGAVMGSGAVLGERALLEGGVRTSTLRAATTCKVAAATGDQLDPSALVELSAGHRREEQVPPNEQ
jgi:CRP-like cAMP-binding protein